MIVYTLLSITLILAAWSLRIAWKGGRRGLPGGWTTLGASLALGLFIYLYGSWVYLSVYCKYVFGLLFFGTLIASVVKHSARNIRPSTPGVILNLLSIIIFGCMSVLYFTGTPGKPETVQLSFPFKKGNYFVLQGGKSLPTNLFHYELRGAIYAMDIVKLNRYGNRASKIFSKTLQDYEIFGDTIYSPCDGIVMKAISDDQDNIPPNMERGPHNTNQVLIEGASFYVFIGHLKQGSTLVYEGDAVKAGQPLGLAGNSGFSLEPHLHIQVHAKTGSEAPWYMGRPLYPAFNGAYYLMNEVINANDSI